MTTGSASLPSALPHPANNSLFKKLRLGGFVAVLYAYCAAGPFGFEEMISTSGPGMSLIFLLVVPWLFSLPMSLATSEMATAMPVQGGFYRWTRAAFGDFWGFQCGWWNWTGTFLMNGAYAVVLADYTAQLFPSLNGGWGRGIAGARAAFAGAAGRLEGRRRCPRRPLGIDTIVVVDFRPPLLHIERNLPVADMNVH